MSLLLNLIPLPWRLLALGLLAVALWGHGWVTGARHGEDKLDDYKQAQQQADTAQQKRVADVRLDLLSDAMILEGVKNDEQKVIAGKLSAALADGVRLRAARPGISARTAPACADGTGAGLSGPNAAILSDFFSAQAARANSQRADLAACTALYNKARDAIKTLNGDSYAAH